MESNRVLPADSTTLPLFSGELLLSRGHAVFCSVPAQDVEAVRAVLAGRGSVESLSPELVQRLTEHGFFDAPQLEKPPEPSVQLQLTNGCNLTCAYCCTNSGQPRQQEVDRERVMALVQDVRDLLGAGQRVGILGGEALLVPWALDVAERVIELGLRLTIFTNGTPLEDDRKASRVAALIKKGAEVRVSLAGPTRELCDGMSGAARFEGAIRGVHQVASHGGRVVVDLMLLPQHVEHVAAHLGALRKQLPADTKIAIGVLYLGGREFGERVFRSRAELEAALDLIAFEAGETIAAPKRSPLAERREGCTCALGHHLHMRSDGSLFTCFKMEEKVADLREMQFADVLHKVRSLPKPARVLATCRDCALATLCGGGCRAENIQFTGDGDVPVCGPWRVRVLSELLAEDRVTALEWPAPHLLQEARHRLIEAPDSLKPLIPSRHLIDI
jgi:radical SAM protein with 4Fe4S-binding SPASM domain